MLKTDYRKYGDFNLFFLISFSSIGGNFWSYNFFLNI